MSKVYEIRNVIASQRYVIVDNDLFWQVSSSQRLRFAGTYTEWVDPEGHVARYRVPMADTLRPQPDNMVLLNLAVHINNTQEMVTSMRKQRLDWGAMRVAAGRSPTHVGNGGHVTPPRIDSPAKPVRPDSPEIQIVRPGETPMHPVEVKHVLQSNGKPVPAEVEHAVHASFDSPPKLEVFRDPRSFWEVCACVCVSSVTRGAENQGLGRR